MSENRRKNPCATPIKFQKGYLVLDMKVDRELCMFLCFTTGDSHNEYINMEKSLPRVKGLKAMKNRYSFVFDLVNNLHKAGLKLSEK